jgi:anti-anti-sigma regulatory factor
MEEAKVLVASQAGVVAIRVIGRATFKVSTKLRAFAEAAFAAGVTDIIVDLSACASMDSTFMGVLAMIGIRGRERTNLVLVNANEAHRNLLDGIGVSMVWRYADEAVPEVSWETLCRVAADTAAPLDKETGATVLDAHRTLMELTPENVPKFKNVVDMVAKELENS